MARRMPREVRMGLFDFGGRILEIHFYKMILALNLLDALNWHDHKESNTFLGVTELCWMIIRLHV